MTCFVTFFSTIFTSVSLIEQGEIFECLNFVMTHEKVIYDIMFMSSCSACGQFLIFFTINRFGAVTFAIIMTTRQALAIFLSCLVYGHEIAWFGIIGIVIVFLAILLRVYLNAKWKNGVKL